MSTKYVAVVDSNRIEINRSMVTESIPLVLLLEAAKLTCESFNLDHPTDKWEVKEIDDTLKE